MWILESRGDFFQGRRMWLKPGKQYLFGRVKKDGVRFALDHKTVSRKHFVISIDDVKEADVGNVHARTIVTITDQGSKTGTLVNGEKAKDPRTLTRAENVIRLGTCQEELIVKWHSTVLTFNLLKKELKAGLLFSKQQRIRELDIKAISDFIPSTSTYLVVNKRNTAKGLQALIDGKHLVAESYIDALEYAATPTDLEEEENLSPLELDFDKAWPNPAAHLPPQGKEPTSRSDNSYLPDSARSNIFHGYTFVFADQTQYDNLLPPITTGHGKALLFPLVEGTTSSDGLITYLRQSAGSKSFGDDHKDSDDGAVILVRWTSKTDPDWTNQLINEVALKLDQRVIEQSEFLDAILASDASMLRRSVPFENISNSQLPPPSTSASTASNGIPSRDRDKSSTPVAPQVVVQGQPRSAISVPSDAAMVAAKVNGQSTEVDNDLKVNDDADESPPVASYRFSPRMKPQQGAFDDDFDEDAIIPFEEDEAEAPVQELNGLQPHHPRSATPLSDDASSAYGPPSRKRSRSAVSADHDLDDFLPTATAMKRRRIAQNGQMKTESPAKRGLKGGVVLPVPKAKAMKDIDVKEELRAQRDKEKKEKETQAAVDEDGHDKIEYDEQGNIAVYEVQTEYMDLPMRANTVRAPDEHNSDRWDVKWNGRKNFKAFRRARDHDPATTGDRRRAHTRLIVPLVDAKQATYGIGDQYWEGTDADREREGQRKKRASQRTTQSQPHSSDQAASRRSQHSEHLEDSDDDEIEAVLDDDNVSSPVSPAVAQLQQEAAAILDDDVDIDQPRRTRADENRTQSSSNNQTQTQTQTSTNTTRGTKRPASSGRGAASKKQRSLPVTRQYGKADDSDSGNDLKFKFGRGRRGRGRAKG